MSVFAICHSLSFTIDFFCSRLLKVITAATRNQLVQLSLHIYRFI